MPNVHEFKAILSGFAGAPGVNLFHVAGGAPPVVGDFGDFAGEIASMYNDLNQWLANGVRIDIDPTVKTFDAATGDLLSVTAITPPAPITSTQTPSFSSTSRATQILIRKHTDGLRKNSVVRGHMFLGPAGSSMIDSNGQMRSTATAGAQAAFGGMLDIGGALRLVVWSRPVTDPNPFPGQISYVQQVSVADVPAIMSSRRT